MQPDLGRSWGSAALKCKPAHSAEGSLLDPLQEHPVNCGQLALHSTGQLFRPHELQHS